MPASTSESYTRAYPEFTILTYTPELGYFLDKAELERFPITLEDCYAMFQPNRLFNQEIIGDIIIGMRVPTYRDTFTNE
jgi:hypothetical protein